MPKKDLDLSFLNQGSEEIELPSRGILYNSKEIKNGKVDVYKRQPRQCPPRAAHKPVKPAPAGQTKG